jgi:hypothetical protein
MQMAAFTSDEMCFLHATVTSCNASSLNSGVLLSATCGQGGIDFAERDG